MVSRLVNSFLASAVLPTAFALSHLKLSGPPSLPQTASHRLDPSLASFSIETAFFETFIGNSSNPHQLSRDLLENLKARTGVPAEMRIGGITADSTFWDPNLQTSSFNFVDEAGTLHNTTIGPGFWDSVKLLPKGTKITVNLNLKSLNYTGAFLVAQSSLEKLDRDLIAFEIGNEPDYYHNFTPENYSEIWAPWARNMTETLDIKKPFFQVAATVDDPIWPYDTPGADSKLDCVSVLAAGANKDGVVKYCSEHTYQYSVCDPPRIPLATLPNLVNHTRLAMYLDLWQPRINSVRSQLGDHTFLIGEYNSVSCSGRDGVSNTFGAHVGLYHLDTTFYGASLNITRMYAHQGGPLDLQSDSQLNHGGLSFYDIWYPVQNLNGPVKVFPSYSAYLFVTETLGHSKSLRIANIYPGRQTNGSSITPAMGDKSEGQLVAYGFWDDNVPHGHAYPTKLALLNLEIYNTTMATPRTTATFDISAFKRDEHSAVRVRRLTAPGADIQEGSETTWAGQTFATGKARGKLVEEKIGGSRIDVRASEAVLVWL